MIDLWSSNVWSSINHGRPYSRCPYQLFTSCHNPYLSCFRFVYIYACVAEFLCVAAVSNAVYNVSWICRERGAKTANCCDYSYFVQLSLVKSCFYSVFCCHILRLNKTVQRTGEGRPGSGGGGGECLVPHGQTDSLRRSECIYSEERSSQLAVKRRALPCVDQSVN